MKSAKREALQTTAVSRCPESNSNDESKCDTLQATWLRHIVETLNEVILNVMLCVSAAASWCQDFRCNSSQMLHWFQANEARQHNAQTSTLLWM